MKTQRIEVNTKEKVKKIIDGTNGKRWIRWWSTYKGDKKIYYIFYETI